MVDLESFTKYVLFSINKTFRMVMSTSPLYFSEHMRLQNYTETWNYEAHLYRTSSYVCYPRNKCMTKLQVSGIYPVTRYRIKIYLKHLIHKHIPGIVNVFFGIKTILLLRSICDLNSGVKVTLRGQRSYDLNCLKDF